METYAWIKEYGVGVKEIDGQHQHYFEITNEITKMTGQENIATEELLVKINELVNYAIYHFATEENFFKHYGYREIEPHMDAHQSYHEKMDKFLAEAENKNADTKATALKMAEFAGSWLINHIMDMDQKYIDFMRSNGIN